VVESFGLLFSNLSKIATVNLIATFLLGLGKLCIILFCVIVTFNVLDKPPAVIGEGQQQLILEIQNPMLAVTMVAMMSYAVTTYIFEVYSMAIDTILLCFCEDLKINDETKRYYMTDELLKLVDRDSWKKKMAVQHAQQKEIDTDWDPSMEHPDSPEAAVHKMDTQVADGKGGKGGGKGDVSSGKKDKVDNPLVAKEPEAKV